MNMKIQTKLKSTILLLTAAISITMFSCSKEETNTETPKTLDKSKLYDKKWYSKEIQGTRSTIHAKSDGTYSISGSWKWINNSDTMEIIPGDGLTPYNFVFHWCTTNEMSGNRVGAANTVLFKDAPW
jgi:hypothetical protein